jgi:hypothetical protein
VFKLLGAGSTWAFCPADPVSPAATRLRGFQPPSAPTLRCWSARSQHQDLAQAALAVRNRFIERFGVTPSSPTRSRRQSEWRQRREAVDHFSGYSGQMTTSSRWRALTSTSQPLRRCGMRGQGDARAAVGDRRVDGGLVPRRHLARPRPALRRPRPPQSFVSAFYGDGRPLTTWEVREIGRPLRPFQNLSAHYLLLASGCRMNIRREGDLFLAEDGRPCSGRANDRRPVSSSSTEPSECRTGSRSRGGAPLAPRGNLRPRRPGSVHLRLTTRTVLLSSSSVSSAGLPLPRHRRLAGAQRVGGVYNRSPTATAQARAPRPRAVERRRVRHVHD